MRNIKLNEVKPINGYVLIKPDPHYKTYQVGGRETGIEVSNHSYLHKDGNHHLIDIRERNYSVRGTVMAVPQNLIVPNASYHAIDKGVQKDGQHKGMVNNFSKAEAFNEYNKKVNAYDTDMELEIGDRVFISWLAHKDNTLISTEEGDFIFIKYDQIVMTIDENNRPKKMINGWVLFTDIEDEGIVKEGALEYRTTNSGLFLPVMSDKNKQVRKKKNLIGVCYLAGKSNRGYKDFKGSRDEEYDIPKGEKLFINKRGSRNLEQLNHREYEEKFFITHRKYIIFTSSNAESQGIDFEKLIE